MAAMPEPPSTRVVRLTPPGRGAIATILVEGPRATRLVESVFRPAGGKPLASYPGDRLVFGHFESGSQRPDRDSEPVLSGSSPAEGVVVRRRSEESVEVHCHGGHAAVERIERALVAQGARAITWQDWATNQHRDPIAAAAHIAAGTDPESGLLMCGSARAAGRTRSRGARARNVRPPGMPPGPTIGSMS